MSTKPTPATKKDKLNSLYQECGLVKEDVFEHQFYTILARSGIEKVQAFYKITVTYKALKLEPEYVVIKAVATMDAARVETYGSAVKANCKNSYFAETAEKRALSRAVLKLTGLYQHGFFGEEESEELTSKAKAAPTLKEEVLNLQTSIVPASNPSAAQMEKIEQARGIIKGCRSKAELLEAWDQFPPWAQDAVKGEASIARVRIAREVSAAASAKL